jgi:hypothetical protein
MTLGYETKRRAGIHGRPASATRGNSAESYQLPVFGMDSQGSCGGNEPSFCSSSMEILSGETTKAMRPSRGGRLMVTPLFISRSQVS